MLMFRYQYKYSGLFVWKRRSLDLSKKLETRTSVIELQQFTFEQLKHKLLIGLIVCNYRFCICLA